MDYNLKKGEVISLKTASSHILRVAIGCIWLTRPNDHCDHLLERGDRFDMDAGGTLVLEALADATIGVECSSESMLRMTIQFTPYTQQNAL